MVARGRWRSLAVLLCFSVVLMTSAAWGAPSGGSVPAGGGKATIQQNGAATVIRQLSSKAIINWQSFGVSANELVRFIQPNQLAVLLNRVTGVSPSVILGSIQANGRIFIMNPNGILFGKGSQVDVGSLLATTLQMSDQNFLNGNYTLVQDPKKSLSFVVNKGEVKAADGGYIVLVAPLIDNEGIIVANLGKVTLNATDQSVVSFDGKGLISYAVSNAAGASGDVVMSAQAMSDIVKQVINQNGVVKAGAVVPVAGGVKLVGAQGLLVNSGTIQANGAAGAAAGTISLHGAQANVQTGNAVVQAAGVGAGSSGGTVNLTGQKVILQDDAQVDVSGPSGGGTANIGGNVHGQGPLPNAQSTFVGSNASVNADATQNGNGGSIAVWSEQSTQVYGKISARGGPQGGDGGFIETSSHGKLEVETSPDASAPKGKAGTWLLDPETVTITNCQANVTQNSCSGTDTYSPTAPNTTTTVNTANVTADLNAGTSVTITTVSAGNATVGDINVNAPIDWNTTGSPTLSLIADNNINVNSTIGASSTGAVGLNMQAPNGGINVAANINTRGGSLTATSQTFDSLTTPSTITTGGGAVNITTSGGAGTVKLSNLDTTGGAGTTTINNAGTLTIGGPITLGNSFSQTGAGSVNLGSNITVSNTAGAGVFFERPVTLTASAVLDASATGGDVSFGNTLDSNSTSNSLTVNVGAGGAYFSGNVGGIGPLGALTATGTGDAVLLGNVTTAGNQQYNIPVELLPLNWNSVITTTANGNVTFGSTLDGTTNPNLSPYVTISAGTGTVSFSGNVGSKVPLGSLTVTGPMQIGGNITTSGAQQYNSAITLTASDTFTTSNGNVTFGSTLDGANSLTIAAGSGTVSFNGNVGTATPLTSLTVTGFTDIAANISTSASQQYNSAVTLTGNATTVTSASGNVAFASTIDGAASLNVAADTGTTTFGGNVGAAIPLTSLTVTGPTDLNASVTTTGTQQYNSPVTLSANDTLTTTNSNVTFESTVDGAQGLAIAAGTGNVTFNGNVGSTTPLTSLTVTGPTYIGGNLLYNIGYDITTSGPQQYNSAVAVTMPWPGGYPSILSTTTAGAGITFGSTIDGPGGLILTPDNAAVSLGGNVGSTTPLGSLTVNGNSFNLGINVTTSGAQQYNPAVTLTADVTLTAPNSGVTFGSTVDGAKTLTIGPASAVATFDGNVGAITPLTSLTVNGGTNLNANVTTAGFQMWGGGVNLGATSTLTTSNSNVTVGAAGDFSLTIAAGSGNVIFNGVSSALSSLTITGPTTINSDVETYGPQVYNSPVTLGRNLELQAVYSTMTFGSTVDGAHVLEVTAEEGGVTFNGPVGSVTPLTSLTVNGPTVLAANVSTTGAQEYGGSGGGGTGLSTAVTLTGNATLNAGSGNVGFSSTIDGGYVLSIDTTGAVSLHGSVGSGTPLTSLSVTAGSIISLSDSSQSSLSVNTTGQQSYNSSLGVLLGSAVHINAGSSVTFGGQVDGGPIPQAVTIIADGPVTFDGLLSTISSLTVTGPTSLGANVMTSGAQTYNSPVTLTANDTLSTTANGNVTFASTVDGAETLTISAGTGTVSFEGNVGSTTPLTSLTVTGLTDLNASVTTTGTQQYTSAVTLTANDTLTTSNSNVTFGSTVDGAQSLTIAAGNGTVSFGGAVGGNAPLMSLTITGLLSLGQNVTTTGPQQYSSPVTLTGNDTLATTNGNVTFGSTVNGPEALTIAAGLHTVNFSGMVGAISPLTSLTVTGVVSLGANVTTTGFQQYNSAVTLAANDALISTSGNIVFGSYLDGGMALTVSAANGQVFFDSLVGSNSALTSMTVTGPTVLDSYSVVTTGSQVYKSPVTLAGSNGVSLTSSGGNITFDSTVDGSPSAAVTAHGTVSFLGDVGDSAAPVRLDVSGSTVVAGNITTSDEQTYNSPVDLVGTTDTFTHATGVITFESTLDGNAALIVDGGVSFQGLVGSKTPLASILAGNGVWTEVNNNITSSGSQTYDSPVIITTSSPVTLQTTNRAVTFGATSLGPIVSGLGPLTVSAGTGAVTFDGSVQLPALTVTGPTTLKGPYVATAGAQQYDSAVTLTGACTLETTTTGWGITFASTIDGANNLTLSTDAGPVNIGGKIGSITPLTSMTVGGGNLNLGGSVTTVGAQQYNVPVTLSGTNVLTTTSGNVTFASTVDGGGALTVSPGGSGIVNFSSTVGGSTPLTSLTVTTPLSISVNVTTTGAQQYDGSVTLTNNNLLTTTSNGNVTMGSTVDGANTLTIAAGSGRVSFNGTVGASVPLTSLNITSAGNVNLGNVNAASLSQTSGTGTTTFAGTVQTTQNDSIKNQSIAFTGSGNLVSTSNVTLEATAGSITDQGQTSINAQNLTVDATGAVNLHTIVNTLTAGQTLTPTTLALTNSAPLTLDNVSAQNGVTASTTTGALTITGNVDTTTNGSVTLSGPAGVSFTSPGNVKTAGSSGTVSITSSNGDITLIPNAIDASSTVTLSASGPISDSGTTSITATGLTASTGGAITLNTAVNTLNVGQAMTPSSLILNDTGSLTLNTVFAGSISITTTNLGAITAGGTVESMNGSIALTADGALTTEPGALVRTLGGNLTVTSNHGSVTLAQYTLNSSGNVNINSPTGSATDGGITSITASNGHGTVTLDVEFGVSAKSSYGGVSIDVNGAINGSDQLTLLTYPPGKAIFNGKVVYPGTSPQSAPPLSVSTSAATVVDPDDMPTTLMSATTWTP